MYTLHCASVFDSMELIYKALEADLWCQTLIYTAVY